MIEEIYAIEWNGDFWQSVFKSNESQKSELHTSIMEAFDYMKYSCGIKENIVIIHGDFQ